MNFYELLVKRRSIRSFQPRTVTRHEMIRRISDESKKKLPERIASNPGDYAKKYEEMLRRESFHIFYHAPAVIFIAGESGLKNLYVDCALAASYLMMSATSKGLGTCWVTFGKEIQDPLMRKELGMGDSLKIVAPIALGYPAKIPRTPNRKKPKIPGIIEKCP